MTQHDPSFEFCQYVHKDGRRCVDGFGHGGDHHVQPQSSVTVQAINRREKVLHALGHDKPVTAESLTTALDNAVAGVDENGVVKVADQQADEDIERNRENYDAALGAVRATDKPKPAMHPAVTLTDDVEPVPQDTTQYVDHGEPQPATEADENALREAYGKTSEELAAEAEAGYDPAALGPNLREQPVSTEASEAQSAAEAPQEPVPAENVPQEPAEAPQAVEST